ncbi:PLP-dependent aminotransferase family protein [uncultured Oscillibacter sp.]|uniref:MocR-like pyridoxine biosynthesis transcription factor PdxR n=1 Tax=uncultured Oscillibacter sp. TaxID=876091 RepID=UPI0025DBC91A|nr:PLP-dependent aminotransferase family protein [uncultured Oscillibacter sp.]
MLTYSMEDRGGLTLYEYLYRRIREDILSGALAVGEKLPSKRALAAHLGVSIITVEGAYQQLEAEGYVCARPRSGFFVVQVARSTARGTLLAQPTTEDVPRVDTWPEPEWKLDLKTNRVDAARFPLAAWARLTRQVLAEEGAAILSPLPNQGLLALRRAICADLRDYRGLHAAPEQIVVGAGAEYLYILLAQLLGRDAVLAVEDPGYQKIRQVYENSGVRCVPLPLDGEGMNPAALWTSGARAAHLSPAHQYPTGLVTPIRRRQELLHWAEEKDGVIIEDDYDSELRFTGRPIPPLQSIDGGGRVAYLNTFSQTIAPSMRMGFAVLPPRLLEQYRQKLGFYACTVPATEQFVLTRFLEQGYYERHLARMRTEYRSRRAAVLEAFRRSLFAGRVHIAEQGAGLHFLLRLDTNRSDQELDARARAMGVRLGFLSEYSQRRKAEFDHTLVVNYAGLERNHLPQAMALLAEIFAE